MVVLVCGGCLEDTTIRWKVWLVESVRGNSCVGVVRGVRTVWWSGGKIEGWQRMEKYEKI